MMTRRVLILATTFIVIGTAWMSAQKAAGALTAQDFEIVEDHQRKAVEQQRPLYPAVKFRCSVLRVHRR